MNKSVLFIVAALFAALTLMPSTADAEVNSVTPSTNEYNATVGWAHFEVTDVIPGATITFVSTRSFWSCFEYRIDGAEPDDPTNYNSDITDGLWPYVCVNSSEETMQFDADELIEIRMVFGAERDERFDWTPIYVPTKDDCKDGGWVDLGFENQGQCISAIVSRRP